MLQPHNRPLFQLTAILGAFLIGFTITKYGEIENTFICAASSVRGSDINCEAFSLRLCRKGALNAECLACDRELYSFLPESAQEVLLSITKLQEKNSKERTKYIQDVIAGLNSILEDRDLFLDPNIYTYEAVSTETRKLLDRRDKGKDFGLHQRIRLNRLLLEHYYSSEIFETGVSHSLCRLATLFFIINIGRMIHGFLVAQCVRNGTNAPKTRWQKWFEKPCGQLLEFFALMVVLVWIYFCIIMLLHAPLARQPYMVFCWIGLINMMCFLAWDGISIFKFGWSSQITREMLLYGGLIKVWKKCKSEKEYAHLWIASDVFAILVIMLALWLLAGKQAYATFYTSRYLKFYIEAISPPFWLPTLILFFVMVILVLSNYIKNSKYYFPPDLCGIQGGDNCATNMVSKPDNSKGTCINPLEQTGRKKIASNNSGEIKLGWGWSIFSDTNVYILLARLTIVAQNLYFGRKVRGGFIKHLKQVQVLTKCA